MCKDLKILYPLSCAVPSIKLQHGILILKNEGFRKDVQSQAPKISLFTCSSLRFNPNENLNEQLGFLFKKATETLLKSSCSRKFHQGTTALFTFKSQDNKSSEQCPNSLGGFLKYLESSPSQNHVNSEVPFRPSVYRRYHN